MGIYKISCKMSLIFKLLHFKSVQTTINVNVSIKYIRINMHLVGSAGVSANHMT